MLKVKQLFALCWKMETFSVEKVAGDGNCIFQSLTVFLGNNSRDRLCAYVTQHTVKVCVYNKIFD
jgi:hypothetical protein